jgi:repressor LexA
VPRAPRGKSRERVFAFMRARLGEGEPPTVREVQEAMGFSAVETARGHLEALVAEGRLEKAAGRSRSYRLPGLEGRGAPPLLVPLLGRVQAGALTLAVEEVEGWLPVQASRGRPEELFALRVRGESMRGAGILPDDLVVVRRQPTATSGEIVVALVGEEATVKRLRLVGGRVELWPENPAFEPLLPRPGEVVLLGKVVEVRRHLEAQPALLES